MALAFLRNSLFIESPEYYARAIDKLQLSLDKQKASKILEQIYANKEAWEFKPYTE